MRALFVRQNPSDPLGYRSFPFTVYLTISPWVSKIIRWAFFQVNYAVRQNGSAGWQCGRNTAIVMSKEVSKTKRSHEESFMPAEPRGDLFAAKLEIKERP